MSYYYIGKKPKKRRRPSAHNRNIKVGKGRTRKRNVLVNPHIKKITKKQYNRIRKLNPKGDYDKDGVKNKDDCYPFDEKKHGYGGWLSRLEGESKKELQERLIKKKGGIFFIEDYDKERIELMDKDKLINEIRDVQLQEVEERKQSELKEREEERRRRKEWGPGY